MTPESRLWNLIKEKVDELIDEAFSFFNLITFMIFEALAILVFVKLHELIHDCVDKSPWCPMHLAVIVMTTLFVLLNVQAVIVVVIKQTRANISIVRAPTDRTPRS